MKLSISNIAWETVQTKEFLPLIKDLGVNGLELCPSMIWPEPVAAPLSEVNEYGKMIRSHGLEFASMHSLTYPHPQLNFYDAESCKKLISYIVELAQLANTLHIPVMVFGGKSRLIGTRDRNECIKIMTDACREIAEKIAPTGVILLIEPLAKQDIDVINNIPEGAELVKAVNHKNFGLHIDMKSSFAEKENQEEIWGKYGSMIRHCHLSDPGMKPPSANCQEHFAAGQAIKKSGYNHFISLEIGRIKEQQVLKDAIKFTREVYFN